jgi:KaiC/GvpD/RAD55 family RecA-like ATPase
VKLLSTIGRTLTGIPGLDEILGGGIPQGRVVLLVGGPGAGKTILATQFLVNGAKNYGEKSAFVSLDESKQHYHSEMAKFGWDIAKLEQERKFAFVDASPIRTIPGEVKIGKMTIGKKDFSLLSLIEGIKSGVKAIDATRIAIDPIASLVFQFPDVIQRRNAVLDLVEALVETGGTCMLTTELRVPGIDRAVQLEEYLAHGVIVLQTVQVGRSIVRSLQVEKMRETAIDMQPRPYRITQSGIEVFPKESIY